MTAPDPSYRLFIAIELPEAWQTALGDLQQRMQRALAADPLTAAVRLRWVRPEGIHLTLKFIGETAADRLPAIEAQLALAVPQMPHIALTLGRAGSFSDRRAPRVIWAGVYSEQADALLRLAESIQTWLAAAAIPRERRAFAAHLTLARLPDEMPDALRHRVAQLTTAVEQPSLPTFVPQHVSLIRSHLGPGGARYQRLAAFPA
jgi:2'-5' RNA ligase